MFNLEAQIKAWRAELTRTGLDNPQSLDELEGHLHEEVERQMRLGANAQQAFEAARGRLGDAKALKREFAKAGRTRRLQISRLLGCDKPRRTPSNRWFFDFGRSRRVNSSGW